MIPTGHVPVSVLTCNWRNWKFDLKTGATIYGGDKQSVRRVLNATVAAADNAPLDIYFALMEAAARHVLRFDERHALRTDNSVADNVGWLDFSHALTFGHALRQWTVVVLAPCSML